MGGGPGQVPDTTPCIWFWGFQICYCVTFFQGWKFFVGSGLGKVPDTTPCLWFRDFHIWYWVRFFPGMKFISFAVVIIFHGVIVCWCGFKAFSTYIIREIQSLIGSYWGGCLSTIKFYVTQWGFTECDSFHHYTISPFHHSKYTCYRDVWVWAMLIVLNNFGLSTYVLT